MPSTKAVRVMLAAAATSVLLFAPLPANATHLFGAVNGNPAAADHTPPPRARITLDPDPVVELHAATVRILSALAVQGFDANGADNIAGNADDWTITEANLSEDSLRVVRYSAYADTSPAFNCGTVAVPAFGPNHHTGGAAFCLTYHPHAGDPAAANIHWIQSILTNVPDPAARSDTTTFPGFSLYLDNLLNPPAEMDPFYDTRGEANGDHFADVPRRPISKSLGRVDWEADVFVVTGNLAAHTLTIYDGARWGFEIRVPEPSTIMLLGVSVLILGGRRLAAAEAKRRQGQAV
jgi:hypothetical protein